MSQQKRNLKNRRSTWDNLCLGSVFQAVPARLLKAQLFTESSLVTSAQLHNREKRFDMCLIVLRKQKSKNCVVLPAQRWCLHNVLFCGLFENTEANWRICVYRSPCINCDCLLLFQIEASEFWYNSALLEGFFFFKEKKSWSTVHQSKLLLYFWVTYRCLPALQ